MSDQQQKFDPVSKPKHYNTHPSGVQCIEIVEHMSFNIGNAVKYLWRHQEKGGVEDLQKARWYILREIERVTKGQDTTWGRVFEGPGVAPEVLIQKDYLEQFVQRQQSRVSKENV
jgi:hypothetical protein